MNFQILHRSADLFCKKIKMCYNRKNKKGEVFMTIRKARPSDIPVLNELLQDILQVHHQAREFDSLNDTKVL